MVGEVILLGVLLGDFEGGFADIYGVDGCVGEGLGEAEGDRTAPVPKSAQCPC